MVCSLQQQFTLLSDTDHRVNSCAENVSTTGFDLKIGTWSDTQVWSATANWLAFAPPKKHKPGEDKQEEEEEPPKKKAKVEEPEKKPKDDGKSVILFLQRFRFQW